MIPDGWHKTVLGNTLTLKRGYDLPTKDRKPGRVPVVSSSGVTGSHNETKVKAPGVVTGRYGTLGNVFYLTNDFWPLNTTLYVKDFKGNYPRFIAYFLKTIGLEGHNDKSSVPGINRNDLHRLEVVLPPVPEQHVIGDMLGLLDDKIGLNRSIGDDLEGIARTIFENWFIDLDFPNEEGKPYRSSGGRTIFNEDLGMDIPSGWNVAELGEAVRVELGGTPDRTRKEFWDGQVNWINSGKVNEFRIIEPSEKITQEGLMKSATKLLPKGTVVLAITGATLGQVSRLEIDSCANQSVVGILENEKLPSEYLYFWAKTTINHIIRSQTGGAQQHINKRNVEKSSILIPSDRVMKMYREITRPVFTRISLLCFESRNLEKTCEVLLPKLMSGEIRVPVEVR